MTRNTFSDRLNGSLGDGMLADLYGPDTLEQERQRYQTLLAGMSVQAGFPLSGEEVRVFSAPGRTELGGNHTDHNRGRVLAAAVQMDAAAIVVPRDDLRVFFRSSGFPDVFVNLEGPDGKPDLSPKPEEQGTSEALVRGIAAEFAKRGLVLGGFSASASSTVVQGSGLSSSAALEVLIAKIFNNLYGNDHCSALELAQISQKAENIYFGKPCGLMDQAASAFGGTVAIDFANPPAPIVQKIEFNPQDAGFVLCVVNTRGSHAELTPDYAAIPREMCAVAECFGKKFLRELDLSELLAHAGTIRAAVGDRALLRAIHFFNEDYRAAAMAQLLSSDKPAKEIMDDFLNLVNESGHSSWELLQNIYPPHNPAEQGLSLALAMSREFFRQQGIKAACRVHGGGFAGTIQAYIPVESFTSYKTRIETVFGNGALTALRIRPIGAVELCSRTD